MRKWEDAVLHQMRDVGFTTQEGIDAMRAVGGKYMRFTRLTRRVA